MVRRTLGGFGVATIVIVAAWLVASRPVRLPPVLAAPDDPSYVSPLSYADDGEARVTVTIEFAAGDTIQATGIDGVITSLYIDPGHDLQCGKRLLAVDGLDRRVFCGKTPLWRTISRHDEGDDVAALAAFLHGLGYENDPTSQRVGSGLAAAITSYRLDQGLPWGNTFEPNFVIFISRPGRLATWEIDLGEQISTGQAVATTVPTPIAGRFSLPVDFRQPGRITIDGLELAASDDGGGQWTIDDLSSLGSAVLDPSQAGDPTTAEAEGMFRYNTPLQGHALPLQSVLISPDPCVIVRDGDGHHSMPVELLGTRSTQAIVAGLSGNENVVEQPDLQGFSC